MPFPVGKEPLQASWWSSIEFLLVAWQLFHIGRAQKWKLCSRCRISSAQQKGIITSLNLLAMVWLMQPCMRLSFITTRVDWHSVWRQPDLRSFSAELLPSQAVTGLHCCVRLLTSSPALSLARCMILYLPLFTKLLLARTVPPVWKSPQEWELYPQHISRSFPSKLVTSTDFLDRSGPWWRCQIAFTLASSEGPPGTETLNCWLLTFQSSGPSSYLCAL